MRALERYLLLQIIDQRWREHLYDMDYLREGIHLRGFAQIEPIVAYKNEAFELFTDLMNTIWSDFARMIFHVEVEVEGEEGAPPPDWPPAAGWQPTAAGRVTYSGGAGTPQPSALPPRRRPGRAPRSPASTPRRTPTATAPHRPVVQQRRVDEHDQIGRNDPCWCGVGQEVQEVPRRHDGDRRTPRRRCSSRALAPAPPLARRQHRRGRQAAEAAGRGQAVEHDRGVGDGDAGQVGVARLEVGHDGAQGGVVRGPVAGGQRAQGVGRAREGLAAGVHRRDRARHLVVAAGDERGDRVGVGGHGRVPRRRRAERRQDVRPPRGRRRRPAAPP